MPTIKQLERAIDKNYKDRSLLLDKLDNLKLKKLLPGLKKKYEGKYFKYNNGYSKKNRWWVYSYCREVVSEHEAIVDSFEFIPNDEWRFKVRSSEGLHLFQQEITFKEFDKNAVHIVSTAKTLIELKD